MDAAAVRLLRERFRRILDQDPARGVLLLAALQGLALLAVVWRPDLAEHNGARLVLVGTFVTAPFAGLILLYVRGQLLYRSGALLRGAGTPRELRAAQAWASLPFLVVAPLRLPFMLLPGEDGLRGPALFLYDLGRLNLTSVLCEVAASVYVFLFLAFLAEAQRFSWFRALLNEVLGAALIGSGLALGYGLYRLTA